MSLPCVGFTYEQTSSCIVIMAAIVADCTGNAQWYLCGRLQLVPGSSPGIENIIHFSIKF